MNCTTARVLVLTAELSQLEGRNDSDLSRHLTECERCRTIAGVLLAAQRELHVELHSAPTTDANRAARHAVFTAHRRRARVRVVRWGAPIAVAAGLATLLLTQRGPGSIAEPPRLPAQTMQRRVTVTPPPGRSVAVMQTADANVVILWFF